MSPVTPPLVREVSRKWKPYRSYTDSGIEWLGRIPAHWETMPLKRAVECPVERGVGQELPFVALEHIVGGEGRLVPGFEWETADASDCATFRPGDVLYGKLRPYLRKYLQVDRDGCCPTELLVLRPATDGCSNRFLYYLVQSQPFVALTEATSYGVKMPRTAWEDLSPCWAWLPPPAEQRAIAAFLDRETAKIDSLISAKERQIELLREKRMAIISQAVTRGLDPNAPLKDSGIEWLGKIPAHWEVRKLKRVGSVRYGLGQPPPEVIDGVPLIRATNVYRGTIQDAGMIFISAKDVPEGRNAMLKAGEIIVVRSGAYTGDSALVPAAYEGAVAGYDMVFTTHHGCNRYYAWQMLTPHVLDVQFHSCRIRAAQPHLNAEELQETQVVVPPTDEQSAIANHLDFETARIDKLVARIVDHIETLREHRTALISAAVTGQIDVRGEV